jgi:predicted molibdopterin-dependent oxidoreductase YjgC
VKSVNAENAAWLSHEYGFDVPSWPGMTAVDMVDACGRGELDVFYNLGGNFLRTLPEPDYVARAMENVPLRVHQDIILTDQMFIEAREEVLLLPAKTRYEQDDGGTETSTERRVMFSPELTRQVGECRAEWKILRQIATATFPDRAYLFGCETGQAMREEIARIVPFYDGVQHLKKIGDSFQYGGAHLCAGGVFETGDHKAHLSAPEVPAGHAEGCFHVSTRRGKQFNTLIYAETDPLTGADRDAVFMSQEDATKLGVNNNDPIVLVNELGRYEGRVFLADIASGNLQVMWPEGNTIIRRGVVDAGGGVPDYNATVRVETVRA